LTAGRQLLPQFPRDHLAELDAFAKKAQIDRDLLIGVNTMVDAYRGGFGCSSLLVSPERSKAGGPLFGRNLDFYTQGTLHRYSLVIVCRPRGKRAFASVGFPGMFGCLSGMNDAGLALAVHEVFIAGDGASLFNPRGTPYTLVFRRVLEECATVDEAERLVRSTGRTTLFNLALCDRHGGVVLEATPRTVAVRRGEDGILACTNHFRSAELGTVFRYSWRHQALMASRQIPQLDLADVARKLHEVNQGRLTLQTMVFEPATLRLHLAIGACPSSALPLKALDLKPLLEGRRP
jgi:predicted choloylglycine hydrolase